MMEENQKICFLYSTILQLVFIFISYVLFCSYTVFKTGNLSEAQAISLHSFAPGFDVWKSPHPGGHAVIMVPPKHKQKLIAKLNMNKIEFTETISNLEE